MFDRLIETEPRSSQVKGRKVYFMVSSAVLSVSLVVSLVASIFSAELDLGTDSFELVELVAPVEQPPMAPEPPAPEREQPRASAQTEQVKLPTRQVNMARVDESPRDIPTQVSTVQNTQKERPKSGYFEVGKFDTDPVGAASSGRGDASSGAGSAVGTGLTVKPEPVAQVREEDAPPPPPVKKDPPKPPPVQSMGVVNGKATNLPIPVYPPAAKAVNAGGRVNVQVLIDERGNVVSASAVSGHPLLRTAAVQAARQAKFSPTLLSGQPVKISGVITYNFNT